MTNVIVPATGAVNEIFVIVSIFTALVSSAPSNVRYVSILDQSLAETVKKSSVFMSFV